MAAAALARALAHGGCVDEHGADQLVLFAALAEGTSRFVCPDYAGHASQHLETAIAVVQQCFAGLAGGGRQPRFTVTRRPGEKTMLVECEGIGYKAGDGCQ